MTSIFYNLMGIDYVAAGQSKSSCSKGPSLASVHRVSYMWYKGISIELQILVAGYILLTPLSVLEMLTSYGL